jgi:hypothetical protein
MGRVEGSLSEKLVAGADRGWFGCSAGNGAIVRVELAAGPGRPPKKLVTVDCPHCGSRHAAKIAWRTSPERDPERPVDLVVGREPTP